MNAATHRVPLLPIVAGLFLSGGLAAVTAASAQVVDPSAAPAATAQGVATCAVTVDDAQRLACYDRLAGRTAPPSGTVLPAGRTPETATAPAALPPGQAGPAAPRSSLLSKFWELDDADKRGTFNFTGYRANYLLPVHASTRINTQPSSPTPDRNGTLDGDYDRVEAKFQLSLRTKLLENVLAGGDLWGGYTQQSLWQLYNSDLSKPFRATDYEPELIYVQRTPDTLRTLPFGWEWRYAQLGLAHQSNGQSKPFSRSWNRVYLGFGFERSDVSLIARVHHRISEDADDDDNPDLLKYRGRGDLTLNWTPGRATASLLWRPTFSDLSRGAWQFDWTYPVFADPTRALRWYVQAFSGYGETLIDYNFRQTSLGVGLTLLEF